MIKSKKNFVIHELTFRFRFRRCQQLTSIYNTSVENTELFSIDVSLDIWKVSSRFIWKTVRSFRSRFLWGSSWISVKTMERGPSPGLLWKHTDLSQKHEKSKNLGIWLIIIIKNLEAQYRFFTNMDNFGHP